MPEGDAYSDVAKYYDTVAAEYARRHEGSGFTLKARAFLERTANDSQRLLEVGCGPGHLSSQLPSSVGVVGTDISTAMLAQATSARPSGQYILHDLNEPVHPDVGKFDLVTASGCLEFSRDLVKVLSQLSDVMNEDAQLYFTILERRACVSHRSSKTIKLLKEFEVYANLWTFQEVSRALSKSDLFPISYEYAPAWYSRTLKKDFNYGYWTVRKRPLVATAS